MPPITKAQKKSMKLFLAAVLVMILKINFKIENNA